MPEDDSDKQHKSELVAGKKTIHCFVGADWIERPKVYVEHPNSRDLTNGIWRVVCCLR